MCKPGFEGLLFIVSGPFCNLEVTSCNPNPCNEGGSCYVDSLGVYCVCKPGFEGLFCELSSETEGGEYFVEESWIHSLVINI